MPEYKKRVAVQLPITPEEFQPIADWFDAQGLKFGRVALKHFQELYAAEHVRSGERIRTHAQTRRNKAVTGGAS